MISSGSVLRALFLAENEVRKVNLPKAAGKLFKSLLLNERVFVCDLSAFRTLCSHIAMQPLHFRQLLRNIIELEPHPPLIINF